MPYDVQQLLTMSQAQLDELFTSSPPGDIPDGEATGTAIVAPGTTYSPDIAKFISHFAWQGKVFDAKNGVLQQQDPAVRPQRHHRQGLQGGQLARWQGMHRPRLLRHLAGRALDPRRDPRDRPGLYLGKVYWGKQRLIDFALQF